MREEFTGVATLLRWPFFQRQAGDILRREPGADRSTAECLEVINQEISHLISETPHFLERQGKRWIHGGIALAI
jgi:hypothetical protein